VTETLFIRLGSQAQDTVHWLITDDTTLDKQEIIASGELANASQLTELTSKAENRYVKVIVPGSDVLLKSLNVPAKSSKAIRLAAPYMLEDNLAEEVDELFFAYAQLPEDAEQNNCFTAIVSHQQMQQWLEWLADADITTRTILPDTLAMPITANEWQAIAIGQRQEQIIVRKGLWQGFVLDVNAWQIQLQSLANLAQKTDEESDERLNSVTINAYSPIEVNEYVELVAMPEELPLALMAKHYSKQTQQFNLMQGQYKLKERRSNTSQQWLWVAGVAMFALLLNLGFKGAQLWQLTSAQEITEQQIISEYKKAFPKAKRVRLSTIKSQLNRELALLGGSNDKQGFLAMLAKLQPAFAKVPALKPDTLKFDGKRQELRIQASANDYQAFEQFSLALADFNVKQGSQSNQGDQVTGSFSISNKKNNTSSKSKTRKPSGQARRMTRSQEASS
jgi:general secretion pathway protein L